MTKGLSRRMKAAVAVVAITAQLGVLATPASAFCGFYVAKADAKLFNKASKVSTRRPRSCLPGTTARPP